MKKPITQKAKSPLKQTDAAGAILGSSTSTYTPGKTTTTTSGGSTVPRARGGGRRATDTEAYIRGLKKRFPDATGQELKEKGYISSAYVDRFPEAVETTVTEPGKTVTRDEEYTPMIQDKYTGITPWENRFNMRTARQSERFVRNEAKRDLRRQAREAARDARQAGDGFMGGRKAKRDIMTGKSFQNETQERLYNTSRGLNEDQNRSYSSDMQQNQFNKGITRGEQFLGTAREMTDADASTQRGQEVIGRHQGYNPNYKYKPKTTVTETTTYDNGTTSTTTSGGNTSSMPGKVEPGKTAGTTEQFTLPTSAPEVTSTYDMEMDAPTSDKALMRPTFDKYGNLAGASQSTMNQFKALEMGEKAAKGELAAKSNTSSASIADAGSGVSKAGDAPQAKKTWRDRLQNTVDNAKAKRAERKATRAEMKEGQEIMNAPRKTASLDIKESTAPALKPTNVKKSNYKGVGGTGMSAQELSDLSEALTDQKNAKIAADNKNTAANIQANTGTADRASYNRTSAPLVDGTPTRENRPPMAPTQMRYEQNIGIKQRTPMKKGYFKNK